MAILENLTLLPLAAALATGLVTSFALGLWRRGRTEADAGIHALCGFKWRDYAHLIEDLLRERGFNRSSDERRPGDGGFDLMMTRGSSRYLVDCKNGAAHRVTDQAIRELASMIELQGAEGAVLATTGQVDPSALQLAANSRIEVLAGADLWRQVKLWVPHELRDDAESRARTGFTKRLVLTAVFAISAGLIAAAVLPSVDEVALPPAAATAPALPAAPVATLPALATQPPTVVPTPDAVTPMAMPDASLTEEELSARRVSAALEVRGNPVVKNAVWSTKSTLVVSLHQPGAEIPDSLFDEVCRILVQHEELRYIRLQIESPAIEPEAAATVRWRQCQ